MKIVRQMHMIRYWLKIQKLEDNKLIKQMYNMLKLDADNNITYNGQNWAYQIKTILNKLGLSDKWNNLHKYQHIPVFAFIEQRILDQYHQTWFSEINNSQRLLTYCRTKYSFSIEPYLDYYSLERRFKIALSRFRLSSHNLEIERGIYYDIPRLERTCKFCRSLLIENEYHFLLTCPIYIDLRHKFLKPYYFTWPTLQKFDKLMMTQNKKEINCCCCCCIKKSCKRSVNAIKLQNFYKFKF